MNSNHWIVIIKKIPIRLKTKKRNFLILQPKKFNFKFVIFYFFFNVKKKEMCGKFKSKHFSRFPICILLIFSFFWKTIFFFSFYGVYIVYCIWIVCTELIRIHLSACRCIIYSIITLVFNYFMFFCCYCRNAIYFTVIKINTIHSLLYMTYWFVSNFINVWKSNLF